MKKPNITEGIWRIEDRGNWCDVISDHDFLDRGDIICQDSEMVNAKAISAVPEMIYALIEAYSLMKRGSGKKVTLKEKEDIEKKIEQALKKAGVE